MRAGAEADAPADARPLSGSAPVRTGVRAHDVWADVSPETLSLLVA